MKNIPSLHPFKIILKLLSGQDKAPEIRMAQARFLEKPKHLHASFIFSLFFFG